jgi:hypothetical protein
VQLLQCSHKTEVSRSGGISSNVFGYNVFCILFRFSLSNCILNLEGD